LLSVVVLTCVAAVASADEPNVVSAGFLGTSGSDVIEGVAIGPEGAVYLAGNTAEPLAKEHLRASYHGPLGTTEDGWDYGCGFVAKVSADGQEVLSVLPFREGVAKLTTVVIGRDGVYVAGYAGEGLAGVLGSTDGLMTSFRGRLDHRGKKVLYPREHHSDPDFSKLSDQRGLPFVLRLKPDLSAVTAGTLLEGWQSVWHVPRPLGEDWHQPVGLAVLSCGDVVVSHDYGFNRFDVTGRFARFYHLADGLSRLSGDLSKRRWKKELYLPQIAAENLREHLFGRRRWLEPAPKNWPHRTVGQTRILRLRADAKDNIYIAGYSPSRTSGEPWWTPFLIRFDADGKRTGAVYTPDPMSGKKGRLHGDVADSCVRSVNVDANGNILAATISDGGNSVLRKSPTDYTDWPITPNGRKLDLGVGGFRGRTLFWGPVVRIDGETLKPLGGQAIHGRGKNHRATPAWATDLAPLPDGRSIAVGRYSVGFGVTQPTWAGVDAPDTGQRATRIRSTPVDNGWLRVLSPKMKTQFSAGLPDVHFRTIAAKGRRVVVVGKALSAKPPRSKRPFGPHAGKADGYILILDIPE
jgi:hypothetical protein